ncbi:hypothetical protein BGW42_001318 [Actinomortierella wolfii]|nr:hypothetical protein BGW42_001318 [Actinomortierella wolfii]
MVLVHELVDRLNVLQAENMAQLKREQQLSRAKYLDQQGDLAPTHLNHPDLISGGLESYNPVEASAILVPIIDPTVKPIETSPESIVTIDLTNDDDTMIQDTYYNSHSNTLSPRLLIDTRLLGSEWKARPKCIYEFTGEARYEAVQQHPRQWRLQARTVRNMDGVDLFTYIHSFRLMQQFIAKTMQAPTQS